MKLSVLALAFAALSFAQTSPFPASLDTTATLGVPADNVSSALTSPMQIGDTAAQVQNATKIPQWSLITFGSELAQVCLVSGNTLTFGTATACPSIAGRGLSGTTVAAHNTGVVGYLNTNAWYQQAASSGLMAVEAHAAQFMALTDFGCVADGSTDDSACIAAALAAAGARGGGVVYAPNGKTVAFRTAQTIPAFVTLDMQGGTMKWTGSGSSTARALTMAGAYPQLRNGSVTTGASGATAVTMANAIFPLLANVHITGVTSTTGFSQAVHVTGDGVSLNGLGARVDHVLADSYISLGIGVDHAISTDITFSTFDPDYQNTTALNIVLDRGTGGVNINSVNVEFGLHGFVMRASANPSGNYGPGPLNVFANQLVVDTETYGDGIVFDSSLSSGGYHSLNFTFTNCWVSGSGTSITNAIVAPAAVGLGIYGGTNIAWVGGRIRSNAAQGVLVNGSGVDQVRIDSSDITANNQANTAAIPGVEVALGTSNVAITGNLIANKEGGVASGSVANGIQFDNAASCAVTVSDNVINTITGVPVSLKNYIPTGSTGACFNVHHNGPAAVSVQSLQPGGYFGVNANGSTLFLIGEEGPANGFVSGFGINAYWDHVSATWKTTSDSGSNGGCVMYSQGSAAQMTFRCIPSNGTAPQSITNAAFAALPNIDFSQNRIQVSPIAFASLPACNSATIFSTTGVPDSTTAVWGATITGGGTNNVMAFCNGSNWTVAGK